MAHGAARMAEVPDSRPGMKNRAPFGCLVLWMLAVVVFGLYNAKTAGWADYWDVGPWRIEGFGEFFEGIGLACALTALGLFVVILLAAAWRAGNHE
jgi:hypothetical protein